MTNKLRLIALAGIVGSFAAAQPTLAQTATIDVSANVTKSCIINSEGLAFGDVSTLSGQAVDGAGTIDVTCTSGTPWTVSADGGKTTGKTGGRTLQNGENALSYELYTDSARSTVWGTGVAGTGTLGDTGTGSSQVKTFYGRIPEGQTSAPAGVYTDTVTATVTY